MNSTNTPVSRIVALVLGGLIVAGLGAASMYYLPAGRWIGPAVAVAPSAPALASGSGNIAITLTPESASPSGHRDRPANRRSARCRHQSAGHRRTECLQSGRRPVGCGRSGALGCRRFGDRRQTRRSAGDDPHTRSGRDLAGVSLHAIGGTEAAHQRLTRLEGLVKIGAASQQEARNSPRGTHET